MSEQYTPAQALAELRHVVSTFASDSAAAKAFGISRGHLCHVLKGERDPQACLAKIGLFQVITYQRPTIIENRRKKRP